MEQDTVHPGKEKHSRQETTDVLDEQQEIQMEQSAQLVDSKTIRSLVWRRRWKRYRWLLWLLLLVPVIYFIVQLVVILAPRMRYDVAMLDTMTDSIEVTGQVALTSQTVAGGQGYLFYTVPKGQRVAMGTEVARLFSTERGVETMDRIEAINAELAVLEEAQTTVAEGGDLDGFLSQLQDGLYDMLSAVENNIYTHTQNAKYEMALAANKMQVATGEAVSFESRIARLMAERESLQNTVVSSGSVLAPDTGYFVPSSAQDEIPLAAEELEAMTPLQLQHVLQQPASYYSADVAGHIVTDYRWYFFTTVSAKEAEKFVEGDKSLELSFPEHGGSSMPVTVQTVDVDEVNNLAAVTLYSEYISPEVMSLRTEKAEIVFGEQKGIRIDKNALRLVDVENEDGSVNTYQGVYVEFGHMVYFRRVQIILEDEFYILVPMNTVQGVNEVQLYDKIVVDPGGVELYDRKIL